MAVSIATQILSPLLLLVGTLAFGISPIAVVQNLLKCECTGGVCKTTCRARRGKFVTSFLIYFGGGVLLATCLVHLLPEAREGFEHSAEHHEDETTEAIVPTEDPVTTVNGTDDGPHGHEHGEEFSMPEFTVCCGFFAVYLLEEIVHFILGGHDHSHIPNETRAIRSLSRSNSCPQPKGCDDPLEDIKTFQDPEIRGSTSPSSEALTTTGEGITASDVSISGLLTVIALSFHSLFEGFAIGIQSTDSRVWILFAAVAVHKFVIAFVVGLEVLMGGGKRTLVIIYMSVFAAMSPLGMIIASITQASVEESNPLVVGVLNALATGTLLYVTFCEILQREEEHKNLQGWQQFLATFVGFGVMCLVQYLSTLA